MNDKNDKALVEMQGLLSENNNNMERSICEIGQVFRGTKKLSFLSDNTLLDYDLVILSLNNQGIFSNHNDYAKDIYEKRKLDLSDFLKHKKTPLVVFAPIPMTKNLHGVGAHGQASLSYFLPIDDFIVENQVGEKINIIPQTIFTEFYKKYEKYFLYNSTFKKFSGISTLKAPHTQKVISFYNQNVIFLPTVKDTFEIEEEFLSDLYSVALKVRNNGGTIELPKWASSYYLINEKSVSANLTDLQNQLSGIESEISTQRALLESLQQRKQIFTGTGDALEQEVKKMFVELGFSVIESEANRDDIIVEYDSQVAVVEIKGVNGTSGEGQAAQLEKWASSYFEKNQKQAKGILIVNSFRDKPLDERKEDTFPNQMLKYAMSREHCLISSLQFLGLHSKAMSSDNKEKLIKTLFNTIGVYKDFEDWREFIETE